MVVDNVFQKLFTKVCSHDLPQTEQNNCRSEQNYRCRRAPVSLPHVVVAADAVRHHSSCYKGRARRVPDCGRAHQRQHVEEWQGSYGYAPARVARVSSHMPPDEAGPRIRAENVFLLTQTTS
jgi:hypothetical protein